MTRAADCMMGCILVFLYENSDIQFMYFDGKCILQFSGTINEDESIPDSMQEVI
jgi:hypothetical protein